MQENEIPPHAWSDSKVFEKDDGGEQVEYHRMDTLWACLSSVKD